MNKQEFTHEYIDLISARAEYFKDKKIDDLTDDEIEEYLLLRIQVSEIWEFVKKTWEAINPWLKKDRI